MSITASIVPWPAAGRPALAGGWRSQGFVIIAAAALPRVRVKFAGSQDHLRDIAGQGRLSECGLRADGNAPGGRVTALCGSQRVEIPDDQRRRGSCRVLIRGTATPHRMRTAYAPPTMAIRCGCALTAFGKTAVRPQQYPRIITGADAGERGGWPDKSPCHEGEDDFDD